LAWWFVGQIDIGELGIGGGYTNASLLSLLSWRLRMAASSGETVSDSAIHETDNVPNRVLQDFAAVRRQI